MRRDSYIFALQLFLLTSDGNLLAIGWLVPEYRLSEFLNPLPQHTRVSVVAEDFVVEGGGWVNNFFFKELFSIIPIVFFYPTLRKIYFLQCENLKFISGTIISHIVLEETESLVWTRPTTMGWST